MKRKPWCTMSLSTTEATSTSHCTGKNMYGPQDYFVDLLSIVSLWVK